MIKKKNFNQKEISLLTSAIGGGGSEKICVNIANHFVNNNWKTNLVVLNFNNSSYINFLSKKINLINLNKNKTILSIFKIRNYIKKNKLKIIITFHRETTIVLLILKILFNLDIKIISRNNNCIEAALFSYKKKSFKSYIMSILIKVFYPKLDHCIHQCYGMKKNFNNYFPKLSNNSSVIYNPIDNNLLQYSNKIDLSKIKKEKYILCVGRLEKQKGFDKAIEAFSIIEKKFPNLKMKIVGQGSLENELKALVLKYSLDKKVEFLPFQKNIIPFYLYAKATVLTSMFEGYPNVLIESIFLNTPVVAFDCPTGPNEIIKNKINGFLAKNQDAYDLSLKLISVLNQKFNLSDLKNSIPQHENKFIYNQYEKLILKFI